MLLFHTYFGITYHEIILVHVLVIGKS